MDLDDRLRRIATQLEAGPGTGPQRVEAQPVGGRGPGRARVVLVLGVVGALALGTVVVAARHRPTERTTTSPRAGEGADPSHGSEPTSPSPSEPAPIAPLISGERGIVVPGGDDAPLRAFAGVTLDRPGAFLQRPSATFGVVGPDGALLYTSWAGDDQEARPSVRRVDGATGKDEVAVVGGTSVATDATRVAYSKGTTDTYRNGQPFPTTVVVEEGGKEVEWIDRAGSYEVAAWAEDALVVMEDGEEGTSSTILAFGPDDQTVFENATPLAVDPSGQRVLVSVTTDANTFDLAVIDVGTRTLVDPAAPAVPEGFGPVLAAAWTDDGVFATTATAQGVPHLLRASSSDPLDGVELTPLGLDVSVPFQITEAGGQVQMIASPVDGAERDPTKVNLRLITCGGGTCTDAELPESIDTQLGFVGAP